MVTVILYLLNMLPFFMMRSVDILFFSIIVLIVSFDEQTTSRYELINYSENGTIVDGVLYSCDFSLKKCHNPDAFRKRAKKSKGPEKVPVTSKPVVKWSLRQRVKEEQELIEKSEREEKKKKLEERLKPETSSITTTSKKIKSHSDEPSANFERISVKYQSMNPSSGKMFKECSCRCSPSLMMGVTGAGWEGSALVNHGSHIRLGCLQFVFSITCYGQVAGSQSSTPSVTLTPTIRSSLSSSSSTISASSTPNMSQRLADVSSPIHFEDS